jgi:hypothetical protein
MWASSRSSSFTSSLALLLNEKGTCSRKLVGYVLLHREMLRTLDQPAPPAQHDGSEKEKDLLGLSILLIEKKEN